MTKMHTRRDSGTKVRVEDADAGGQWDPKAVAGYQPSVVIRYSRVRITA